MGLQTNLIRLHFVGWVKTRQRCRPTGQTKRAGNGGSSWPTGTLDPPYKLVDQVQQLCCPLFAQAMGRFNTRRAYWHHLRCCFEAFRFRVGQDCIWRSSKGTPVTNASALTAANWARHPRRPSNSEPVPWAVGRIAFTMSP